MDKEKQRSLANSFREMHHESKLLVLPNAWDVASARIFEEAGVRAIATSSAGVAFSLGFPDGQRISRDEMLGGSSHHRSGEGSGDRRRRIRIWDHLF